MAQYVRTEGIRRVEPVAFWSGPLEPGRTAMDAGHVPGAGVPGGAAGDGRGRRDRRPGVRLGERKTRVRDPLVLLPTLPRILSFDETLQVPVTVRNDTGKAGPIQVGLTAQGPVKVEGPAAQPVDMPVGRERTVYFTVKTGPRRATSASWRPPGQRREEPSPPRTCGSGPTCPRSRVEDAGAVSEDAMDLTPREAGRFRPETVRRELRDRAAAPDPVRGQAGAPASVSLRLPGADGVRRVPADLPGRPGQGVRARAVRSEEGAWRSGRHGAGSPAADDPDAALRRRVLPLAGRHGSPPLGQHLRRALPGGGAQGRPSRWTTTSTGE